LADLLEGLLELDFYWQELYGFAGVVEAGGAEETDET